MRLSTLLVAAAGLLALVAGLWLGTFDLYNHAGCAIGANGERECSVFSTTVVEENGEWVWGLLALPVIVCTAVYFLLNRRTRLAHRIALGLSGALVLGCLVGGFSIGLPFLPAALLLFVAVILDRPAVPARA